MTEISTSKSIFALTVVVGCFAILWPKIFFPMLQAALRMLTSDASVEQNNEQQTFRPPHFQGKAEPSQNIQRKPGRPPIPRHPGHMNAPQPQSSHGGIMGLVMPVYTIGVILFFFYTLFKVMSRKPDKTPKLKNFNMDPEHRKFVFSEEYDGDTNIKRKSYKSKAPIISEAEEELDDYIDPELESKESELDKLRNRLAKTEAAMSRILKQMGDASHKLSATVPEDLKKAKRKNDDADLRKLKKTVDNTSESQLKQESVAKSDSVDAEKKDLKSEKCNIQNLKDEIVEEIPPKNENDIDKECDKASTFDTAAVDKYSIDENDGENNTKEDESAEEENDNSISASANSTSSFEYLLPSSYENSPVGHKDFECDGCAKEEPAKELGSVKQTLDDASNCYRDEE